MLMFTIPSTRMGRTTSNMLKLNNRQKRQPFGGHHFVEKSITFRGDSFDELVKKLKEFRVINSIPLGDPEQDVLQFYAKNWPYMVEVRGDSVLNHAEENDNYRFWRGWIYKAWSNPMKKQVTEREACERWDKCHNCPFNMKKDWPETDESKELEKRSFILRRGVHAPLYAGYCRLHRADISAFTFSETPREFSSKPKGMEDYDGCWV